MKRALSFFMAVLILLSLASCQRQVNCEEILTKLLAVSGEDTEGSGSIFFKGAEEGEKGYFSPELMDTMYGENAGKRYFSKIEDFSVYVSEREPGELAVFRCYSYSDRDVIAEMCLQRADSIKVTLRDSEYAQKTESIQVIIYRRYVVFSFTDAPRRVEDKFKALV